MCIRDRSKALLQPPPSVGRLFCAQKRRRTCLPTPRHASGLRLFSSCSRPIRGLLAGVKPSYFQLVNQLRTAHIHDGRHTGRRKQLNIRARAVWQYGGAAWTAPGFPMPRATLRPSHGLSWMFVRSQDGILSLRRCLFCRDRYNPVSNRSDVTPGRLPVSLMEIIPWEHRLSMDWHPVFEQRIYPYLYHKPRPGTNCR